MLAFSNDYYGFIFRATQSVELFCAYIACVLAYKNGISIIFMNTYLALILATILHILNYWKGENGYETN